MAVVDDEGDEETEKQGTNKRAYHTTYDARRTAAVIRHHLANDVTDHEQGQQKSDVTTPSSWRHCDLLFVK